MGKSFGQFWKEKMKSKFYYTAHRITAGLGRAGESDKIVLSHNLAPQQDIIIVRRPFSQMLNAIKIENVDERRKQFMNGTLEDREFVLIFEHGFYPEYPYEELKKGKNYWCESSNQYLHTSFGLTEIDAVKALLKADNSHSIRKDVESSLPQEIKDRIAEQRNRFK